MAAAEPGPEAEARGEAAAPEAEPLEAEAAAPEAEAEAAKPLEPEVAQEAVQQVEFYFSDENLPTCVGPALAAPAPPCSGEPPWTLTPRPAGTSS